jgi:Amidohydrolase family
MAAVSVVTQSTDPRLAMFKQVHGSILVFFLVATSCADATGPITGTAGTFEFRNGRWFDGQGFVSATMYTSNGVLTTVAPASIDASYDLADRYVIPPLGESHTHTLLDREERIGEFMRQGIFYAAVMNQFRSVAERVRPLFNLPTSVDIRVAVGGITGHQAHPVQIGLRNGWSEEELDGDWVHVMDTAEDVDNEWTSVLESGTDFIKVFLVNADEYESRRMDPAVSPRYRGLNPSLLPDIVVRGHAAGLTVAAHIRTAIDFRLAVEAGVDEIAHLPGFSMGPGNPEDRDPSLPDELIHPDRFRLTVSDAVAAAGKGIVVHTTIQSGDGTVQRGVQRENLQTLRDQGVVVVLGSDAGERTVVDELHAVASLGVFDEVELLRMLTMTTPRHIFPGRRIGCLDEGCEASFLVLTSNPLGDLGRVGDIELLVKDGEVLDW